MGDYQSEISRDDPNSQVITQWTCTCPWDQYAFQRTRQWKKYEGRPCAHVLAAFWESQSTPLDEDVHPATQFGQTPAQGFGTPPSGQPRVFDPSGEMSPGATQIPGMTPPPGQAPTPDILPPFPGDQAQGPPAVSVPGGRQPTPANPVQYPGGTFSSWSFQGALGSYEFKPGDVGNLQIRLEKPTYGQLAGKSEAHGAGSYKEIPVNSIGTFMGQDQTTGWCWCIFAGPQAQAGPMEPYHVEAWLEPKDITPMPNIKPPGPFIKRRG